MFISERFNDAINAATAAEDLGMSAALYRGLVRSGEGLHADAMEGWLEHFGKLYSDDVVQEVKAHISRESYVDAYRLMAQTFETDSRVLSAMLYSLAGDAENARKILSSAMGTEANWVALWARRVPILKRAYADIEI